MIGVHSRLESRAPDVVEFLRNWDFSADSQVSAEAWREDNNATFDEAAVWFLKSQDVWSGWVPNDVFTAVRTSLDAQN